MGVDLAQKKEMIQLRLLLVELSELRELHGFWCERPRKYISIDDRVERVESVTGERRKGLCLSNWTRRNEFMF